MPLGQNREVGMADGFLRRHNSHTPLLQEPFPNIPDSEVRCYRIKIDDGYGPPLPRETERVVYGHLRLTASVEAIKYSHLRQRHDLFSSGYLRKRFAAIADKPSRTSVPRVQSSWGTLITGPHLDTRSSIPR